jgi:hypothetical protein
MFTIPSAECIIYFSLAHYYSSIILEALRGSTENISSYNRYFYRNSNRLLSQFKAGVLINTPRRFVQYYGG